MSENVGLNEQALYDWMSKEEYEKQKINFLQKNRGKYLSLFNTNGTFPELSPEMKTTAADLTTRFLFGVWTAYRRFGSRYSNFNLEFDIDERYDYEAIGFHAERDTYCIKESFLSDVSKMVGEEGNCYIQGAGIDEVIPAEDFFEIVGVEEAAHFMFYNEKGNFGRPNIDTDSEQKYYTSDIESSGLIWKTAYAERYMPQYHTSLKRTVREVQKIRMDAKKSRVSFDNS